MPYCHQCRKDFKVFPACPQCGLPLVPRATAGLVVSEIAGAIVLITAFLVLLFYPIFAAILSALGLGILIGYGLIIVIVGLVSGILMMVGGALIYLPGKERAGAAIVLVFSIVSIVVLGGFIVGITMGIVGAALGFAKK
jgi:hypothetical protein